MPIATAVCTSFKQELLQGGHCIAQPAVGTWRINVNLSNTVTISSGSALISIGMGISSDAPIPFAAGTRIAGLNLPSSFSVYPAGTSIRNNVTPILLPDQFKIALIKLAPTGTYNAGSTNYSNITSVSDETVGTGYTVGGVLIIMGTINIVGGGANFTVAVQPSWTSATFSTSGCMIYSTESRLAGVSGRAMTVISFGNQTITNGTFTVLLPTASPGLIQLA